MKKNITVLGGDSRQLYAAEYLTEKGYKVNVFACEHGKMSANIEHINDIDTAFRADIIILPLPVSKNGNMLNTPLSSKEIKLKDITDKLCDRHTVFFGMGSAGFMKQAEAKAEKSCDYYNIEGLIYKNALLTAEGIISIILERIPVTVFGMKIAITGFGRIAGFTADKLKKLGADVTVFARNDLQLIKASTMGIKSLNLTELYENISGFDCVINTVPSPVIDKKCIEASRKDCVFIETASAPYGINAEACNELERTMIKAFSLPGKIAPKSAGIIIGETIYSMLKEVK